MADKPSQSGLSGRAALLIQGSIGLIGLVIILWLDIPVQSGGLSWFQVIVFGCLGAAGTYGLLLLLYRLPGVLPRNIERVMQGLHGFATGFGWPVLIGLSVLAGVGEELLFRGAIQGWLTEQVGVVTALILASLLFGLVHYVSFLYFLIATGLGLLLGAAYVLSDSLALVMVWHAVYDLIALYSLLRFPHWFGLRPPPNV